MNITFQVEIDNSKFENFSNIIKFAYKTAMEIGRKIVLNYLQNKDEEIKESRDKKRYRSKGKRKTCIKTILGDIEYEREVYIDKASPETVSHVYLLDEELKINRVGHVSEEICQYIASSICVTTYRDTARQIAEITDMSISAQGVWNITQAMGAEQKKVIERHAELAKDNKSVGELESKILYEENDGIWLALQGKDRKENGKSKEMKVGIAYDGVREKQVGKTKRRILADKVAYASFEQAAVFRKHKEGLIRSRYNTDETDVRVINGDGAQWIFGNEECTIQVLDKFHRNKMMRACIKDEEFLSLCMELLYDGKISLLLACIEGQINSVEDEEEKANLSALYRYYKENEIALTDYFSRDIAIPKTRDPEIHHARLGSMESNVFTLIGNRMKNRRACWSINGANNLALLLCAYYTIGFENMFVSDFAQTEENNFPDKNNDVISCKKVPESVGRGYEFPRNVSIPEGEKWLISLSKQYKSFSEIKII